MELAYSLDLGDKCMNECLITDGSLGPILCWFNCLPYHTPMKKEILKSWKYLFQHAMETKLWFQ